MTIDRNSPIPIYHQLKTLVREQIERGIWQPGDRIPTEHEMCELYGISRSPVRQALNELAYEGLLIRRPGLGTFVNDECTPASSSHTPIHIMTSDPYWTQVLVQASRTWNGEHPDRKIRFRVDLVDHGQFYELLSAAVGSGTAPDAAMVDCVWVAGLAQAGFLYALEDLSDQWDRSRAVRELYPAFIEANSHEGKMYGLPVKADASLLWYRRDWFDQEGLSPPRDWDDLLDTCRHFLQPRVRERYGLDYALIFLGGIAAREAAVYSLMPFVWSAGGEIFDTETGAVVLDGPGTRHALQFLRELVAVHAVSPPEVVRYQIETIRDLFIEEETAMTLGGSHEGDIIRDVSGWSTEEFIRRVGCTAPPAAPGKEPVPTVGGTSYVVLRQCPNAESVMEVLNLAIHPDVIGDLYLSMRQNSPYRSFDGILNPGGDSLLRQASRMIASGRARPSIPEYVKISRQLQIMFEEALSSSTPVDEIVKRTAQFISVISGRPCRPA